MGTDIAGPIHRGLLFDVAIDAESFEQGATIAIGIASRVASLLSLASGASTASPRPLIIYLDRGDGGCDVRQYGDWPLDSGARRMLPQPPMQTTIALFNALPVEDREEMFRGLDWYVKAGRETIMNDRFAEAWSFTAVHVAASRRRRAWSSSGPHLPALKGESAMAANRNLADRAWND